MDIDGMSFSKVQLYTSHRALIALRVHPELHTEPIEGDPKRPILTRRREPQDAPNHWP